MSCSRRGASCYNGPLVDEVSVLTSLGQVAAADCVSADSQTGLYRGWPRRVLLWHRAGTVAARGHGGNVLLSW